MTPRRALAATLLAALATWAALAGGGAPDTHADPEADRESSYLGGALVRESSLRSQPAQFDAASPRATADGQFQLVFRDAGNRQLLPGVRVDSGADGALGISTASGIVALTRPGTYLAYEATRRGYLMSRGLAHAGRPTTVLMTAGVAARGVVLDAETRAPIAEATLRVWDEDAARFISSVVTTDINGRFELLGVRLHHPFTILTHAGGSVQGASTFQVFSANEDLTVLVGAGGVIKGLIQGLPSKQRGGIPIFLLSPGQRVPGDEMPGEPSGESGSRAERLDHHAWTTVRTETNKHGHFAIRGVPLDRAFVVVARIGAQTRLRSDRVILTDRGRQASVEFKHGDHGGLEVRFVDETGRPVDAATYRLVGPFVELSPRKSSKQTHLGGVARFGEVPSGTYTLIATRLNGPEHRVPVELGRGLTKEIRIVTPRGATLTGRVVGPGGLPVPRARLTWTPQDPGDPVVRVTADHRAAFTMRGVRGAASAFRVEPPLTYDAACRYRTVDMGEVRSGQGNFVARLEARPPIEGSLFGPRPIKRFELEVITKHFRQGTAFGLEADGRFTFRGPPESPGLLVFRAPDLAPRYMPYSSPRDADEKLARVWVTDAKSIPLTVHAGGKPARGVRVRPTDPRSRHVWRTDVNGELDLPQGPEQGLEVVVDTPFHTPVRARIRPVLAGKRNHIELGPELGIVHGTVQLRRHRSLLAKSPLVLMITRTGGGRPKTPDTDGTYTAPISVLRVFELQLPPGRYEGRVTSKGGLRVGRLRIFTVRAGERVRAQSR